MNQTVIADDAAPREEHAVEPLYANRVKVHPKDVRGRFRRLKWAALGLLLGIYYILPWVRWDRGPNAPDQAVLIDMVNRRTWFFFIELWPQEVYYFTGLLVLAALGLFLVTSLAGRVWCGYACPQTVWTDLFQWVERRIEGDRNARIKLDAEPFGWRKARKRLTKHAIWLVIAAVTGGAWIMYFNDAPTVVREIFTGQASLTVYGFVALFAATTYLLAGWAREQVCTYMCPWPRWSPISATAANRAASSARARSRTERLWATAWRATSASPSAPPASTSATASSWSASAARCASTPATPSWTRSASRAG